MRFYRTTGLTSEQLLDLVELLRPRTENWSKGRGRPKSIGLFRAVALTVAYMRQNIVQVVLAEYFDVSQATVSRIICQLTPLVADVLDEFIPNAAEATRGRVVLVDGSLTPCWSWARHRELYSGKHHTTGHNVQVLSDLDGYILYITQPRPGSTHDIEAFRRSGLSDIIDLTRFQGVGALGGRVRMRSVARGSGRGPR